MSDEVLTSELNRAARAIRNAVAAASFTGLGEEDIIRLVGESLAEADTRPAVARARARARHLVPDGTPLPGPPVPPLRPGNVDAAGNTVPSAIIHPYANPYAA